MKNFGDNTYSGKNTFQNDVTQIGDELEAVFTDTSNDASIVIDPGDGTIESINITLHFNRLSGQLVAIGADSDARVQIGQGNQPMTALLQINNTIPNANGLRIDGANGQSANLLDIRNNSGNSIFSISPNGDISYAGTFNEGNINLSSISPTPQIGNNIAGTNLSISAGIGTGNALPSYIDFLVPTSHPSSSTTSQSLASKMRLTGSGLLLGTLSSNGDLLQVAGSASVTSLSANIANIANLTGGYSSFFGGNVDGDAFLSVRGNSGYCRSLYFATGIGTSNQRWEFCATEAIEGGSDTGSNFELRAYKDNGVLRDRPLQIPRNGTAIRTTRSWTFTLNNDSTSTSTGTITCFGGAGFAKNVWAQNFFTTGTSSSFGNNSSSSQTLILNAIAASNRHIGFCTTGNSRWELGVDSTPESGNNAGSNFALRAYADNGNLIDTPVSLLRRTGGAITFSRPVVLPSLQLSALNTPPAAPNSPGTLGEVRFCNGYIYLCVAANTWQRTPLYSIWL